MLMNTKYLIEHGADVNLRDDYNAPPHLFLRQNLVGWKW